MQTIITKYLGATNHRAPRIKASCQAGSVIVPESWGHIGACGTLRAKLGWTRANGYADMIGGETKDGMAWVFVHNDKDNDNWANN